MTTLIATVLYILCLLYAYIGGVSARGNDMQTSGASVALCGVMFLAATALTVWG